MLLANPGFEHRPYEDSRAARILESPSIEAKEEKAIHDNELCLSAGRGKG